MRTMVFTSSLIFSSSRSMDSRPGVVALVVVVAIDLPLHCLKFARERVHDALHGRLHFLVGQRAIEGLERETERQADLAVRDALALIPIELADLDERVGRGRPNGATNRIRRQGIRD